MEVKNKRNEKKNDEDKNETLKGNSGKRRNEKNRKSAEGMSQLSHERQTISVKKLKILVKKKTPVFLAVVWVQENRKVNATVKTESIGLAE